MRSSTGRNDPCPCGSGKKFKKCCAVSSQAEPAALSVSVAALIEEGKLLQQSGRPEEAALRYREAITARPDESEPYRLLGTLEHERGNHHFAIQILSRALELDPRNAAGFTLIAAPLAEAGMIDDAVLMLRTAVELQPDYVPAWTRLGALMLKLEQFEGARAAFQGALHTEPDNAAALNGLGAALRELGDLGQARRLIERAIALAPENPLPYNNMGDLVSAASGVREALPWYEKAIALKPDCEMARANRALCLLKLGRVTEGFDEYEWRIACAPAFHARYPYPRWQGESLEGRTILVYAEQGVGDEIMFANCFPELIAAAGRVIIQCDPRLQPLFARSFPQAIVHGGPRDEPLSWLDPLGPVDLQVAAGSLPRFFRRRIEEFPKYEEGYLKPDPERVEHWRRRLAEFGNQPKIGICWRSGRRGARRDAGYTAIDEWAPILGVPGVRFVNLQYDDCEGELARAGERYAVEIVNFGTAGIDLKDDIDGCAALYKALDLVISPGTTVASLAGALGVSTHFLFGAGWPGFGTEFHPWYSRATTTVPLVQAGFPFRKGLLMGTAAWLANRYSDVALLGKSIYRNQTGAMDINLYQGLQAGEEGDWPRARQLMEMDYSIGRLSAAGHLDFASAYGRCGEWERAFSLVAQAYEMDSGLRDGYARLGWIKTGSGEWRGAEEVIAMDMAEGRLSPLWKLNLAMLRGPLGKWEEASDLVAEAYEEEPTLGNGFSGLGWIGYLSGRGIDFFSRGIDKDRALKRSGKVETLYNALFECAQGRREDAVRQVEREYRNNMALKDWLARIGWLSVRLGDLTAGGALMTRDWESGRMSSSWYPSFAVVLAKAGDGQLAHHVAAKALDGRSEQQIYLIGFPACPDGVLTGKQVREIVDKGNVDEALRDLRLGGTKQ